jgi:hypothetical protein
MLRFSILEVVTLKQLRSHELGSIIKPYRVRTPVEAGECLTQVEYIFKQRY